VAISASAQLATSQRHQAEAVNEKLWQQTAAKHRSRGASRLTACWLSGEENRKLAKTLAGIGIQLKSAISEEWRKTAA
jgi:hypothetical protein